MKSCVQGPSQHSQFQQLPCFKLQWLALPSQFKNGPETIFALSSFLKWKAIATKVHTPEGHSLNQACSSVTAHCREQCHSMNWLSLGYRGISGHVPKQTETPLHETRIRQVKDYFQSCCFISRKWHCIHILETTWFLIHTLMNTFFPFYVRA